MNAPKSCCASCRKWTKKIHARRYGARYEKVQIQSRVHDFSRSGAVSDSSANAAAVRARRIAGALAQRWKYASLHGRRSGTPGSHPETHARTWREPGWRRDHPEHARKDGRDAGPDRTVRRDLESRTHFAIAPPGRCLTAFPDPGDSTHRDGPARAERQKTPEVISQACPRRARPHLLLAEIAARITARTRRPLSKVRRACRAPRLRHLRPRRLCWPAGSSTTGARSRSSYDSPSAGRALRKPISQMRRRARSLVHPKSESAYRE